MTCLDAAPAGSAPTQPFWAKISPQTNNFDLLRIVLATVVVFSHSFVLLFRTDHSLVPFQVPLPEQCDILGPRVCIFFLMSGFLVAHSWERSSGLRDFFVKRIARIYPAFAVSLLVTMLIIAPLSFIGRQGVPGEWLHYIGAPHMILSAALLDVPFMADLFPRNPYPVILNLATWSLRYEFTCYIALAVVAVALRRRKVYGIATLFAIALVLYLLEWIGIYPEKFAWETHRTHLLFDDMQFYPRVFTFFLGGALFYYLRERIASNRFVFIIATALLFTLSAWGLLGPAFGLLGPYLTFYVVFHPRLRLPELRRWTSGGAGLSYGIYLYSCPLQQLIIHLAGAQISPYALFLGAMAMVLPLAALSQQFIDSPIQTWIRSKLRPGLPVANARIAWGRRLVRSSE